MRIAYRSKKFSAEHLEVIDVCNEIIEQYMDADYQLTLRQLFYQLVARMVIPNKQTEYKRVGRIINDARDCGLMDWEAFEDRTRNLSALPNWDGPRSIIKDCALQFRYDHWEGQANYVEVWVEKEALAGVIERTANRFYCPWLACKGYLSQSVMWEAGRRYKEISEAQDVVVIYLGDHDPSGMDITNVIEDRLERYAERPIEVRRVALNFDQVEQFHLPPNPAKKTDSRFKGYLAKYGTKSWELDALNPEALDAIITDAVELYLDRDLFDKRIAETEKARGQLRTVAANWDDIVALDLPEPKGAA